MKLNRLLGQIMSAPNFDHFSAVELRAAYITMHSDKNLIPSDARRFVYAELVKLVNNGWLRKTVSKKKEITTFIKTSLFNIDEIIYSLPVESTENFQQISANKQLHESLRKRLNQYKNELLISYGESNEYKKLCDDFPDLYELLQPQYNNAREQNSRLLGQIKAVEKLINESDK